MPPRKRKRESVHSKTRYCWTTGEGLAAEVYIYEDDEIKYSKEVGTEVTLYLRTRYANSKVTLTDLISDELDALQIVIEEAFALARETVYKRDEVAREIFDQTGEPLTRLYRRSPILVHRTGSFREYSKSVLDRLKSIRELAVTPATARSIRAALPVFPTPGLSGEIRPELAESNPQDSQPEHDAAEVGVTQGVRQVLRDGDSQRIQTAYSSQADAAPDPRGDNGSDEHAESLPDAGGESASRPYRPMWSPDFGSTDN